MSIGKFKKFCKSHDYMLDIWLGIVQHPLFPENGFWWMGGKSYEINKPGSYNDVRHIEQ
jgi:hypothetical protein